MIRRFHLYCHWGRFSATTFVHHRGNPAFQKAGNSKETVKIIILKTRENVLDRNPGGMIKEYRRAVGAR